MGGLFGEGTHSHDERGIHGGGREIHAVLLVLDLCLSSGGRGGIDNTCWYQHGLDAPAANNTTAIFSQSIKSAFSMEVLFGDLQLLPDHHQCVVS